METYTNLHLKLNLYSMVEVVEGCPRKQIAPSALRAYITLD